MKLHYINNNNNNGLVILEESYRIFLLK